MLTKGSTIMEGLSRSPLTSASFSALLEPPFHTFLQKAKVIDYFKRF